MFSQIHKHIQKQSRKDIGNIKPFICGFILIACVHKSTNGFNGCTAHSRNSKEQKRKKNLSNSFINKRRVRFWWHVKKWWACWRKISTYTYHSSDIAHTDIFASFSLVMILSSWMSSDINHCVEWKWKYNEWKSWMMAMFVLFVFVIHLARSLFSLLPSQPYNNQTVIFVQAVRTSLFWCVWENIQLKNQTCQKR